MGDEMLHHQREPSREGASSILGLTMLQEPVIEEKFPPKTKAKKKKSSSTSSRPPSRSTYKGRKRAPDRVAWEYHSVSLSRVAGYGFGIAVSGGRDNPHFANGDPAIAISDVLKAGPAEGKLLVNDRILSANGVSLENVDYATAVQVLRDNSTVQLVVKRRVLLQPEVQAFRVSLSRTNAPGRKNDFGLNLSTKLYIKDFVSKSSSLQEGDVILRINNTSTEGMSLKEAKKLMEGTKDKLQLLVKREGGGASVPGGAPLPAHLYSSQNLYVQPPRRASEIHSPRTDFQPIPPPRPPPPSDDPQRSREDFYASSTAPRLISFNKEGPLGIRLGGGTSVGIFIAAVQSGSEASSHGLSPGDKLLSVNGRELGGMSREEAVNLLLSLSDEVKLVVVRSSGEWERVVRGSLGDSFYVKTNFSYEKKGELHFKIGEIFQVTDTLVNGTLGYWGVIRYTSGEKGVIPNLVKASELMSGTKNKDGEGLSFFRRKKESVRSEPYERVVLRHPGFMRPIVLLGSVGDIARERLVLEHPDIFTSPPQESHSSSKMVKLSAIREIMKRGQHAVLDVTAPVVEKLNLAQLYPIVLLVKVESKKSLKEIRGIKGGGTLLSRKSPSKLLSISSKLESSYMHIITSSISVNYEENWLRRVKDLIEKEQSRSIWMAEEAKPLLSSSDECLFPLSSSSHRASYASSPDSERGGGDESNGAKNSSSTQPLTPTSGRKKNGRGIELPNYNEPPAYSVSSTSGLDKSGIHELYPLLPISSSSQGTLEKSLHLDHSPPESPTSPPPLIDRTKKPKSATERLFGDPVGLPSSSSSSSLLRSSNNNGTERQLIYEGRSNNNSNYEPHSNVYRFTRSTAQPPMGRDGLKGSYSPYRTLESDNGCSPDHYSSHSISTPTNGSRLPPTSHPPRKDYTSSSSTAPSNGYGLYNNGPSLPNGGGGSLYYSPRHHLPLDSNGNPIEEGNGSSPYKPPPPPKLKPVPPPKPLKPLRMDLGGGGGGGGSSSFYLNVPINVGGQRGASAFELYRKESR